jgi:hypothetical protein
VIEQLAIDGFTEPELPAPSPLRRAVQLDSLPGTEFEHIFGMPAPGDPSQPGSNAFDEAA